MLILTRYPEQSIMINDNIEVMVLNVIGNQVRIGVTAPREVSVHRKEIHEAIKEETTKKEYLLDLDKPEETLDQTTNKDKTPGVNRSRYKDLKEEPPKTIYQREGETPTRNVKVSIKSSKLKKVKS